MIFLTRRGDMSREQLCRWWLEDHRPLAERLPGLQRHAFNLLPESAPYDAVVEQWFVSRDALESAYLSAAGEAVAADSGSHVAARQRLVVEEHAFTILPQVTS